LFWKGSSLRGKNPEIECRKGEKKCGHNSKLRREALGVSNSLSHRLHQGCAAQVTEAAPVGNEEAAERGEAKS
jgi:hypothetical protein